MSAVVVGAGVSDAVVVSASLDQTCKVEIIALKLLSLFNGYFITISGIYILEENKCIFFFMYVSIS